VIGTAEGRPVPRNLDTALLRTFVAVAETGGMTRAASVLRLTQAAVSQQVKRLEESLGCALFLRDRPGLGLTPAGERLLARAQRLLAVNDEIWTAMTAPEFEGQVRLGVPTDIVVPLLPPVLRAFNRDWPGVQITLEVATSRLLRQALAGGAIDLCLATETGRGEGGETLFADEVVWAGAVGGTAWQETPLPLGLGDPTCAFRAPALDALAEAGRDWRRTCECRDMLGVIAAAEADLAVGLFMRSILPPGLAPVPPEAGLPALPAFNVNLYVARPVAAASSVAVEELALHIRRRLAPRPAAVAA
jgi:DNA-binding transcriptional LysR family regulator